MVTRLWAPEGFGLEALPAISEGIAADLAEIAGRADFGACRDVAALQVAVDAVVAQNQFTVPFSMTLRLERRCVQPMRLVPDVAGKGIAQLVELASRLKTARADCGAGAGILQVACCLVGRVVAPVAEQISRLPALGKVPGQLDLGGVLQRMFLALRAGIDPWRAVDVLVGHHAIDLQAGPAGFAVKRRVEGCESHRVAVAEQMVGVDQPGESALTAADHGIGIAASIAGLGAAIVE